MEDAGAGLRLVEAEEQEDGLESLVESLLDAGEAVLALDDEAGEATLVEGVVEGPLEPQELEGDDAAGDLSRVSLDAGDQVGSLGLHRSPSFLGFGGWGYAAASAVAGAVAIWASAILRRVNSRASVYVPPSQPWRARMSVSRSRAPSMPGRAA